MYSFLQNSQFRSKNVDRSIFLVYREIMSLRSLSQTGQKLVTLLAKSEPLGVRWTHSKVITPNLWLTSESKLTGIRTWRPSLENFESRGRPLSILMVWLMSKKNAINKYTQFYHSQGEFNFFIFQMLYLCSFGYMVLELGPFFML